MEHGHVGHEEVTAAEDVRPSRVPGLVADVVVVAVVTAAMIRWSFQNGRLALYPEFDDVAYFAGSLFRLREWDHGIWAVLKSYWTYPAHSPVSDFLGVISFATFGVHDWSPYAGNGVLLLAVLRLIRHFARSVTEVSRWCLAVVAVTLPMMQELVMVFRPDEIYGWVLAAAVVRITTRSTLSLGLRGGVSVGLWLGLLLLIKTSTYPQTLVVIGFALVLRTAYERTIPGRASGGAVARAWVVLVVVAAVVAGPFYAAQFADINRYIRDVLFGGNSRVWQFDLTARQTAMFYVTGLGGAAMFGPQVYGLIALLIGVTTASFATASPRRRREYLMLLLVLAATYAIPTLNKTKSAHLGTPFQSLVVLSIIFFTSEIGDRRRFQQCLSVAVAIAAVLMFHWPHPLAIRNARSTAIRNGTVEAIWTAIQPSLASTEHPRLAMTSTGPMLNPSLFAYLALKWGDRPLDTAPNPLSDDLESIRQSTDESDLVIASEPGTGETDPHVGSTAIQDKTLAMMRSRDDFDEIATAPAVGGGRYVVFVKRAFRLDKLPPFYHVDATGLSPVEGPYPGLDLPAVRIGMYPVTTLTFTAAAAGRYELVMDVNPAFEGGQAMTIRLNGQWIGEYPRPLSGFRKALVRLDARAGVNHVEITYAKPDPNSDRPKAVLFRSLRVLTADEFAGRQ